MLIPRRNLNWYEVARGGSLCVKSNMLPDVVFVIGYTRVMFDAIEERCGPMSLERELAFLQSTLAMVDLSTHRSPPGRVEYLLKRNQPIALRMDGDKNHNRPHIHVDYGPDYHVASYAIDNGDRLAGTLDRKYDRSVREWIEDNRSLLLEAWAKTQAGKKPDEIICALMGSEFG